MGVNQLSDYGSVCSDVEKHVGNRDGTSSRIGNEHAPKNSDLVGWDGPDDPENPMNWPSAKKVSAIAIVSLMALLSPLGSTMISPATTSVLSTFNSSDETLGAFVTSVYLLGYTFGPLVVAPLSEMYGRAVVYHVCNFLFVVFNVACALSNSLNALIVFRLLTGIAASCPVTIGAGSVADIVPLEKRGLAMIAYAMGPVVGPSFGGPLAGAYFAQAKGWRWIFWLLAILATFVFVVALLGTRESYAYVILERKTQRLRRETGNQDLRSVLDRGQNTKDLFETSIVRPLKMLFLSPIVFLISLYMAVVYSYMYLMFTTFSEVFQGQYGFSESSVGLTYLGVGVGSVLGLIFCGALSDRLVKRLTGRNGGIHKAEFRLPLLSFGAFLTPIGLFWYGWSVDKKIQWMIPIIGTGFVGAGVMITLMSAMTYLVNVYTEYAASASAAGTVFRSLLGALLPLAGNSLYDSLGLGWGTSVLGFIAVAFVPVPFVFWQYGEEIRNSRFSQVEF